LPQLALDAQFWHVIGRAEDMQLKQFMKFLGLELTFESVREFKHGI
jgi:hypothetical protein